MRKTRMETSMRREGVGDVDVNEGGVRKAAGKEG
jgi:hypothetical protein